MPNINARGRLRLGFLISPATKLMLFQPSNAQVTATRATPSPIISWERSSPSGFNAKSIAEPFPTEKPKIIMARITAIFITVKKFWMAFPKATPK